MVRRQSRTPCHLHDFQGLDRTLGHRPLLSTLTGAKHKQWKTSFTKGLRETVFTKHKLKKCPRNGLELIAEQFGNHWRYPSRWLKLVLKTGHFWCGASIRGRKERSRSNTSYFGGLWNTMWLAHGDGCPGRPDELFADDVALIARFFLLWIDEIYTQCRPLCSNLTIKILMVMIFLKNFHWKNKLSPQSG